jgi:LuxR family maltose regulon positive regulatory protein
VLYQRNDLAGAAPHIQRAVELGELGGDWWRMHGYRMLAYLKQAEGDWKAAHDLFQKSCVIGDALSVRQMNVATEPSLEQLRILLGHTRPELAHLLTDLAQRIDTRGWQPDDDVDFSSPEDYPYESEYSDLARSLIALGRAAEAIPLLERLLKAAQSMERQGDAIRYLTLQALAFHTQGDTPTALASLDQALTLAEPKGYVRIFVDEGEPMATLLRQAASCGDASGYVERLLAEFPGAQRTSDSLGERYPSENLVEPLSDREIEVLQLMAAGLKHKEIGEQLVISLNTVRHHTRNIYSRLNVNSRAQAIAKARELNLL